MFSKLINLIKNFIIQYLSNHWIEILIRWILAVCIFLAILFIINIISKKIEFRIEFSDISNNKYTKRLSHLVGRIIFTIWIIFNILIVCEIIWINVSLLMAWISLGLWFAMETMIWNIISWVFILTNKKFKIWDFVEVLWNINTRWTIEEINLKHTIIRWLDKRKLLIPNSVMANTTMKTLKSENLIRWDLKITLPRHINIDQIKTIINETTNSYENIEHKEYTNTFIESFDKNWYNFHTVYFIDPKKSSILRSWSEIRIKLSKIFKQYWIKYPYQHLITTTKDN